MARLIFVDLVGSVIWFPIWWYTKGLLLIVNKISGALKFRVESYGFKIWLKNFFVPMYGQYDITGRLVSVFMRLVVLIGRSVAFAVESAVYGVGLLVWLAAPVVLVLLTLSSFAAGTFLKSV